MSTKLRSLSPTNRPRVPPIDETRSVNVYFGICVIEVYLSVLKYRNNLKVFELYWL